MSTAGEAKLREWAAKQRWEVIKCCNFADGLEKAGRELIRQCADEATWRLELILDAVLLDIKNKPEISASFKAGDPARVWDGGRT